MVSQKSQQDSVSRMAGSYRRLDKMKQVVARNYKEVKQKCFVDMFFMYILPCKHA